ncbi:MAG: SpoIID/LytB domain-containing protein [Ardenticatenia bacterium]|nr:SpoIID/LytB domain-containing protein [Ardenticatenia bacterium]
MYWLTPGGARREPYTLCTSDHTAWGCTAFCDESGYPCDWSQTIAYPYATNPATVPIETDYLLDVLPQEMGTYYHPIALQAQAIAARTYAYWHINQGSTINNSTSFQTFIPYKFESLTPATFPDNPDDPCASSNLNANQRIICNAVAPRHYISYNGDLPAFTEFTGDVFDHTISHPQQDTLYPYLLGVDNPISTACDANDYGHRRGMSQEGASRWARGNQCSYAGTGDMPWSVRWERAEQILLHYYTGVHIRDADHGNARLTPSYRWNPLSIDWGTPDNRPPIMYHGQVYNITVQVQNTSIYDWPLNGQSWALSYHWAKAGAGEVDSDNRVWTTVDVPKGDPPYSFTLTIDDIPNWGPSAYTLKFDMVLQTYGGTFWFSETYGWPTYDVGICVDGPCQVFIPAVLKNYGP